MAGMGKNGEALLRLKEGDELKAYLDSAGVWTIGIGHTKGVTPGMVITEEQKEELFQADMADSCGSVDSAIKVPMTANQRDAMIMLDYNIGDGSFDTSTVARLFNKGDVAGAAAAFSLFNKRRDKKTGKLVVSQGLINRRAAEVHLFTTPDDGATVHQETGAQAAAPKPMRSSLTVQSALTTLTGGLATIATVAPDIAPQIQDLHDKLGAYGFDVKWMAVAAAAFVVIGSVGALWGRIRVRLAGAA